MTHCDGSDTEAEVSLIMSSVKSFSDTAGCGRSALLLLLVHWFSQRLLQVGSFYVIIWGSDTAVVQEIALDWEPCVK